MQWHSEQSDEAHRPTNTVVRDPSSHTHRTTGILFEGISEQMPLLTLAQPDCIHRSM